MARRNGRRLLATWGPVLLVLSVLAAGFATYRYDLGERWWGERTSSSPAGDLDTGPATDPAAVPPPAGLDLPVPATPPAVAAGVAAADSGQLAPGKVRRLLDRALGDPRLGDHVVAGVADLSTGAVVYRSGASARPASTTKLLTAAAALHVLGPDHRFTTRVMLDGRGSSRRLVLVGGGDPYLASRPAPKGEPSYPQRADVRTLARKAAQALLERGRTRVRLAYDDTLFTGPDASPGWEPDYLPDGIVAPIRALWVDEGRPATGSGRVGDPSAYAAQLFAEELGAAGVVVTGAPQRGPVTEGAVTVAEVQSAPLDEIVERVLTVSDNEAAEVLAHQVGLASGGQGSFAGGVRGVRQALVELGVEVASRDRWYDGSGLSRRNVLSPALLLGVLEVAASAEHPELRAVVTGLPVAGFSGSLEYRFETAPPAARGHVRAKTGTLRGTSGLAGIATDLDGTSFGFVVLADRVPERLKLAGQDAVDEVAAALAGCHCSVGSGP